VKTFGYPQKSCIDITVLINSLNLKIVSQTHFILSKQAFIVWLFTTCFVLIKKFIFANNNNFNI